MTPRSVAYRASNTLTRLSRGIVSGRTHFTLDEVKRLFGAIAERDEEMAKHGLPGVSRGRHFTTDQWFTYDQMTIDSTGAFLIGELERMDQTLHDPLVMVSWGRDIDLREDVTMGDEFSAWTTSTFAMAGGIRPTGKNWASKRSNTPAGVSLDMQVLTNPLPIWEAEVSWTLPELASAQQLGRPVDQQKYAGMKLKWQMDVDEQVYVGDPEDFGYLGLCNNTTYVTPSNVVNGAQGSPLWINKTPDEILNDVNTGLNTVWANSAYKVMPEKVLLPPTNFSLLVSRKVSSAGNVSILEFLKKNSLTNAAMNKELDIQPLKWLPGLGVNSTNRMVVYTQDKNYVRFPLVPLQRTPIEFRSLYQITTYYGRLGVVEFVYPTTVGYFDGL